MWTLYDMICADTSPLRDLLEPLCLGGSIQTISQWVGTSVQWFACGIVWVLKHVLSVLSFGNLRPSLLKSLISAGLSGLWFICKFKFELNGALLVRLVRLSFAKALQANKPVRDHGCTSVIPFIPCCFKTHIFFLAVQPIALVSWCPIHQRLTKPAQLSRRVKVRQGEASHFPVIARCVFSKRCGLVGKRFQASDPIHGG